jgi:nucleoid-associated protein YgaU
MKSPIKRTTKLKLLASTLLVCAAVTAGCHNANKKSTTQQAGGFPPMNMAALNVPTAPLAAAPPPPTAPAVAMTPPAAAQPVVYDPPAAEPAADEAVADASDSVAPVRRSRPAPAAAPARKASASSSASATKARYTIKKGESLWSIAEAKYGDGHKWKRIAAANPKLNPNRVQAGQTITLP